MVHVFLYVLGLLGILLQLFLLIRLLPLKSPQLYYIILLYICPLIKYTNKSTYICLICLLIYKGTYVIIYIVREGKALKEGSEEMQVNMTELIASLVEKLERLVRENERLKLENEQLKKK